MKKLNLGNSNEDSNLEIVVQIRDKNGKPTGKTKSVMSDNPSSISDFYNKQKGKKRKKKNKRRNPDGK